MISVLASISPKYCELIASGKKTVEIRKTIPKIEPPFKVYVYCTLSGSNEFFKEDCKGDIAEWNRSKMALKKGKVIGEFICDNIETIKRTDYSPIFYFTRMGTCLEPSEMWEYGKGKPLYAWHISDLIIYDKPKELSEFKTPPCERPKSACGNCKHLEVTNTLNAYEVECYCYKENGVYLTRPPQSWCYVEECMK